MPSQVLHWQQYFLVQFDRVLDRLDWCSDSKDPWIGVAPTAARHLNSRFWCIRKMVLPWRFGDVGCDWPGSCDNKLAGASLNNCAMNLAASSSACWTPAGAAALVGVDTTVEVSSAKVVETGGDDWSDEAFKWDWSKWPRWSPAWDWLDCDRACAKIASNSWAGMLPAADELAVPCCCWAWNKRVSKNSNQLIE